jgi:hypothetical protein
LCDEIRQSGFRSIARADKDEADRRAVLDAHAKVVEDLLNRDNDLALMRAERDALKATVERVRALKRVDFDKGGDPYHSDCGLWIDYEDLDRALADPVSETFTRLNSYGVPYESRNRRGLTGHDARGRRHEDTHNCVRYTPLTWDRRKRTRRGGRRK